MAEDGAVYLVGAGPGDPRLITVRGLQLLRQADVVVYDRLAAPELLDEAPRHALRISAAKSPGCHTMAQDDINALLIDHARRGRTVVRLKGGDPFVFGRGIEELEACRAAGVACNIVPGVSSAIAAPAAAGIPVTHRGIARAFAVVTAQVDPALPGPPIDYAALARLDTVVVLMGRERLAELAGGFIAAGRCPDTPAACVQEATTPRQRTIAGTLATIAAQADAAGIGAPMVLIIGEVARAARDDRDGSSSTAVSPPAPRRALEGRRILVTRPLTTAEEVCRLLLAMGASVLPCPLIRIVYPRRNDRLDAALRAWSSYHWLVVTSVHGAAAVERRLRVIGAEVSAKGACRVAAVGSATADALRRIGLEPDLVPSTFTASVLADRIKRARGRVGRVLYPRSSIAPTTFAAALREAGGVVDDVVAYQTRHTDPPRDVLDALRSGVDAVAFFSPSAVRRFAELAIDPGRAVIACIGTTTAAAAREAGLVVEAVADPHTSEGLVAALVRALPPLRDQAT